MLLAFPSRFSLFLFVALSAAAHGRRGWSTDLTRHPFTRLTSKGVSVPLKSNVYVRCYYHCCHYYYYYYYYYTTGIGSLASLVNPPCFLSAYTQDISLLLLRAPCKLLSRFPSLFLFCCFPCLFFYSRFSLCFFLQVCWFFSFSFFSHACFFSSRIKRMIESGDERVSGFRRLFVGFWVWSEFFIRSIFVGMRDRI